MLFIYFVINQNVLIFLYIYYYFVSIYNNFFFYRFEKAKIKIAAKYAETERGLIEEFVKAHRSDDKVRMRDIASLLSHFRGYPQCVDAFIEQSQMVWIINFLINY